jgi:hypothetical protein
MKALRQLLLLLGFISAAFAQGKIDFEVTLEPVPGFEWFGSSSGRFSLEDNILNGTLIYTGINRQSFTRIENSLGGTLFTPTEHFSLAPIPAEQANWLNLQLNASQVNELVRNEWRINIGSVDYPDGALRGQIIAVPEPGAIALFALGALFIWTAFFGVARQTNT